ncbi:radical SAM protein [Ectothiorhodospiraceae bacterium BW-2]|nr:radical SAM protein [Ectothiorhodospiraceae bacterium BW-2]
MSTHPLYSHLKFIAYPDRLDALLHGELAAPVHVRIKPYNHCNHDCWYCAYRMSSVQIGGGMDTSEALPETKMYEIVEDLIEMNVAAVTFSGGGEPLLYKPLPKVIKRLYEGGIKVGSLTNASNLKGAMADSFAEYGTWLRVSIDAVDGEHYGKVRGISNNEFGRVLRNMEQFAARGSSCVLGVSFIICHENHHQVYEACRLFKQIGVHNVSLSGVYVENDGAQSNAYHDEIRSSVEEQIERAQRELVDAKYQINDNYGELNTRFDMDFHSCPFLQFQTVIGADGIVYTCHDKAFTEGGKLGSILERSFKDFWFSEENRQKIYAIDPAKDCKHHCGSRSRNELILEYLGLDREHITFV